MAKISWLERFRHLRLVVKRAVATLQAGTLPSVFKGAGLAFEEVRHYQPGDDIRTIDWNVTARMGQPYVKRFVEERELRIHFVLDVSGSQQIGSMHYHKRDVAAEVVALLCLAGLRQGDSLGLATFTREIESYLPPRRGMHHALRLIYQALYQEPEKKGTNLARALQFIGKMARRRSVVVILSDFLDENWQGALDRLAYRHDIFAIATGDPLDTQLPAQGLLALCDAETGKSMIVDSARSATAGVEPTVTQRKKSGSVHWIRLSTDGSHAQVLLNSLRTLRSRRRTVR